MKQQPNTYKQPQTFTKHKAGSIVIVLNQIENCNTTNWVVGRKLAVCSGQFVRESLVLVFRTIRLRFI